jgi:hypothetical protein
MKNICVNDNNYGSVLSFTYGRASNRANFWRSDAVGTN